MGSYATFIIYTLFFNYYFVFIPMEFKGSNKFVHFGNEFFLIDRAVVFKYPIFILSKFILFSY